MPDGPIPWTAALLYAQHKGIAPDVFDIMWAVIRRMDIEERRWIAEERKRAIGG